MIYMPTTSRTRLLYLNVDIIVYIKKTKDNQIDGWSAKILSNSACFYMCVCLSLSNDQGVEVHVYGMADYANSVKMEMLNKRKMLKI